VAAGAENLAPSIPVSPGIFQMLFYETSSVLIPKPDKVTTRRTTETYWPIYFMNIETKVQSKLAN
jgi:hypothetical protein